VIPYDNPLLVWLGKDWAWVTFRDGDDVAARRDTFADPIRRWIEHV
jgi:hypothetical protein